MSDFTAIGQLVNEARNLLDSIKGGAIRKMETAFDALKSSIASEWNGIKTKMNNEALAAIGRVDTQTVISDLGFSAYNINGDFLDVNQVSANKNGHVNVYPLRAGVGRGRNDGIESEMISCSSGSTPAGRHPIVRELLDFMGVGADRLYFSGGFNVWKITVVDPALLGTGGVDFHIPTSHMKHSPSTTFMQYVKTEGDVSLNFGGNTGGVWDRYYYHAKNSNPALYSNIDLYLKNAKAGDVVYVALPMMCTGKFPQSVKHGSMINLNTMLTRKIDSNHQS
ncbi:phage tail protein [Vibrio splendidus]